MLNIYDRGKQFLNIQRYINNHYNMTQVKQNIQPYIPIPLRVFYKNKEGCKDMYNTLIIEKKNEMTSVMKWREKV